MSDKCRWVWAVAERRQLTNLIETYCDDFEAFCDGLEYMDEAEIVSAICSLTFKNIGI